MGPESLHPRCVQRSFEVVRRYLKEKARFETSPSKGGPKQGGAETHFGFFLVPWWSGGGSGGSCRRSRPRFVETLWASNALWAHSLGIDCASRKRRRTQHPFCQKRKYRELRVKNGAAPLFKKEKGGFEARFRPPDMLITYPGRNACWRGPGGGQNRVTFRPPFGGPFWGAHFRASM